MTLTKIKVKYLSGSTQLFLPYNIFSLEASVSHILGQHSHLTSFLISKKKFYLAFWQYLF